MHSSLMKKVSLALALALALVLSASLVACGGKSDEEVIREGVTAEFESIKKLDDDAFNELLEGFSSSAGDLSEFGIDNREFITTWLEGFDYSIDDVKVNGDDASVTTTITVKSLEQALTNWQEELTAVTNDESIYEMTESELYQLLGSMLMDAVRDAPMVTSTVDLPYTLNGNTWEPGAGFDSALGQAFLGSL